MKKLWRSPLREQIFFLRHQAVYAVSKSLCVSYREPFFTRIKSNLNESLSGLSKFYCKMSWLHRCKVMSRNFERLRDNWSKKWADMDGKKLKNKFLLSDLENLINYVTSNLDVSSYIRMSRQNKTQLVVTVRWMKANFILFSSSQARLNFHDGKYCRLN